MAPSAFPMMETDCRIGAVEMTLRIATWNVEHTSPLKLGRATSVDSSNPAINRHFKSRHLWAATETMEFYFVASSVRKSVWTLVRQLRGPHLSTWA